MIETRGARGSSMIVDEDPDAGRGGRDSAGPDNWRVMKRGVALASEMLVVARHQPDRMEMMMASDDITTQILIEIREDIRQVRSEVNQLRADTNERFDRMELRFLKQTAEFKQVVLDHTHALIDLRVYMQERDDLRSRMTRCEREIEELKQKR